MAQAEAAVFWQVLPFLYVRPHVGASGLLDSELRAASGRSANVVLGIAAGSEF